MIQYICFGLMNLDVHMTVFIIPKHSLIPSLLLGQADDLFLSLKIRYHFFSLLSLIKSIHKNLHLTKGLLVMSNIVIPVVKFPQDCDTIVNVLTGMHNLRIQASTTDRLQRVSPAQNKEKSKIHIFVSGNFRWFGFCPAYHLPRVTHLQEWVWLCHPLPVGR